jgi:hypothetical protein
VLRRIPIALDRSQAESAGPTTIATEPAMHANYHTLPGHSPPPTPGAATALAIPGYRNPGRWIGVLMLLGFAAGMLSNFALQSELFKAPGFLLQAAGQTLEVGLIALLGMVTGLLSLATASILRRVYGERMPLLTAFFFALVAAGLAINVLEGATVLAMRSLSEDYLAAGAGAETAFEPARQLLRGLRNGIHFPNKLLGGFGVLLMFALLLAQRGLPRGLAGFGVLAAALQMFAIAQELFGREVNMLLLAPLALVYPASALWLLVRGVPVAGDGR